MFYFGRKSDLLNDKGRFEGDTCLELDQLLTYENNLSLKGETAGTECQRG